MTYQMFNGMFIEAKLRSFLWKMAAALYGGDDDGGTGKSAMLYSRAVRN